MRQSSRAESPIQSPPVQALHPVLSRALANLDIQLENELARYRRQRAGTGQTLRHSGRKSATKSLDLISVIATGGRTRPPVEKGQAAPASAAREASRTVAVPEQGVAPAVEPIIIEHESMAYPDYAAALATDLPPSEFSSSELAIAVREPDSDLTPESNLDRLTSADSSASSLMSAQQPPDLDDYLESSEELLRSLAAEEAEVDAERGFMQSLLTPLGAGSMLLLLLSSAMFGYLVMNPSSLSRIATLWRSNPTLATSTVASSQPPQEPGNIPQPNLANSEFKDLNLYTLGAVKVGTGAGAAAIVGPAGAASPGTVSPVKKPKTAASRLSTQVGAGGSSTTAAVMAPARSSSSAPVYTAPVQPAAPVAAPRRSAPASSYSPPSVSYSRPTPKPPAPAYAPPAVTTPPPPASAPAPDNQTSADSYPYKVVTPFESDRTLEEAKTASPDAYVRQFSDGAKIQMGAYKDSAAAESRIEELRQQGISADVYKR